MRNATESFYAKEICYLRTVFMSYDIRDQERNDTKEKK